MSNPNQGKPCYSVDELFSLLDFNNSIKWKYIVLHHSEDFDSPIKSDFERIKEFHIRERHWSDISYHIFVEYENNKLVYKIGRQLWNNAAAHIGFNNIGIAICICGNFDKEVPSIEQWNAIKELVKALQSKFNILKDKVIAHRETYDLRQVPREKECCGKLWDIEKFRREL